VPGVASDHIAPPRAAPRNPARADSRIVSELRHWKMISRQRSVEKAIMSAPALKFEGCSFDGWVERLLVIKRDDMYGLKPTDIGALKPLLNAEITQICVGPHDIRFNFHPQGNVSVQGRCELVDSTGRVVEVREESTRSGTFRFPELLMTPVVDAVIESAKSFVLTFRNGMALRAVDNSQQYESF
jgi:hypothetical protein